MACSSLEGVVFGEEGVSRSVVDVNPGSVLQQLQSALDSSGCIRDPQDAPMLVSFMKQSTNQLMVHRFIVLNVIKATDSHNTLAKFMDAGGWTVLNSWLAEAKRAQNNPLLLELLAVLEKLPVNVDALKQGNMGKIVKQLSKQDNTAIQSLAADLLAKWMSVFRESQSAKSKSETEVHRSGVDNDPNSSAPFTKSTAIKKEKKVKKKDGKAKGSVDGPPPESMQLPPGPMVALGRPKEKSVKRARDVLTAIGGSQPPADKKTKIAPPPSPTDVKPTAKMVESEGFMNALQAAKMKDKKVKKASGKGTKTRTNSSSNVPGLDSKQNSNTKEEKGAEAMEVDESSSQAVPEAAEGNESSKKKKRVSWASADNLAKFFYFELDESERVNVNRSFLDAAYKEKMREREALESGLMFSRDRLFEMVAWQRPVVVDIPDELVERGADSKERSLQAERENKVLAQLFLSKSSVPPSPLEPDPESEASETELKLIPLMEPGAPPTTGPPAPTQPLPPPPTLPPMVFASPSTGSSSSSNVSLPPGMDSPLPSPATTINQAQNLINFFNKQNQQKQQPGDPSKPPPPGHPGNQPRPPGPNYPDFQGPNHNGAGGPPGGYHGNNPDYYPAHSHRSGGEQGAGGPGSTLPRGSGKWAGPDGFGGGKYYEGYQGQQRGRGFGRGRGRGGPFPPWRRGGAVNRICKHFQSYQGCKLGTRCRFLHCTPEEFDLMNAEQGGRGGGYPGPGGRNFRGRGGRFGGPPRNDSNNGEMFSKSQSHPDGGGGYIHPPPPHMAASYSPPHPEGTKGEVHKPPSYSSPNPSRPIERENQVSEHQEQSIENT